MPTPPKKTDDPAPAPTGDPDPTTDPEPRELLKAAVREVLDEYAAERATDPKRTQKPDFWLTLFGG